MKFTEKDLLKAMGLKVGDLVRVTAKECWSGNKILQVTKECELKDVHRNVLWNINLLICEDNDYEVIKQTGTYGNARCSWNGIECKNCPLRMFDCRTVKPNQKKLKDIWKELKQFVVESGFEEDEEIIRIIEQRLDQYIVDEKLRKLVEQDEEQDEKKEKEKGEK